MYYTATVTMRVVNHFGKMKYRFSLLSLAIFLSLLLSYHMQRVPLVYMYVSLLLLILYILSPHEPIVHHVTSQPSCHAEAEELPPSRLSSFDNPMYEDERLRIWSITLSPGHMTPMHQHSLDCHLIVLKPALLEVWSGAGQRLFDFNADVGATGYRAGADGMLQVLPRNGQQQQCLSLPRTHATKNIGSGEYAAILVESKSLSVSLPLTLCEQDL